MMMTESGVEFKLVGGLQVFNCYVNSEYLGKVKVANHFTTLLNLPPNPLKRLVGAQGLEPWTRCLKGSGYTL